MLGPEALWWSLALCGDRVALTGEFVPVHADHELCFSCGYGMTKP